MEAKDVGTNRATLTVNVYEQAIIHEALTQLAKNFGKEYTEDIIELAKQLEGVRL